jgi:hypothetical protein
MLVDAGAEYPQGCPRRVAEGRVGVEVVADEHADDHHGREQEGIRA